MNRTDVSTERGRERGRLAVIGAAGGVVGLAAVAIAAAAGDATRAAYAYLAAFGFAVSIAVGSLILLMIGYAVNASWLAVLRRLNEALAWAVVPLVILFVPVILWLEQLYPWVTPEQHVHGHHLEMLEHKLAYLDSTGFVVRAAVYFAVWITAAVLLGLWSRRRDAGAAGPVDEDPRAALSRERKLSCALLPFVALAMTFAAFDWLMSLQPLWFSAMFGVYYFAGGFLAAIAALTVGAKRVRDRAAGADVITGHHFHALGRLLLAFTIFWTYCAYFQLMLIEIANKPEEVVFYLARDVGAWRALGYVLIVGHFAIPFAILLFRSLKFRPRAMAGVAGWLLAMHAVDVYWLTVPALPGAQPQWVDLAAFVGVTGVVVAAVAWRWRATPPLARRDPFFAAGVDYRSPT